MKEKQKQDAPNLWAVGSVGIDAIKTTRADRKKLLGGSLPFITVAASFYARCGGVGVVGRDFPASFERRWTAFDVDLRGIEYKEGNTFRWACKYDPNMCDRHTLSTDLGVFRDYSPELPQSYMDTTFILLGNIQPELQIHVLEQAKNPGFVALDTMNLWIMTANKALRKVIKRVDLLTLNDSEAHELAGATDLYTCGRRLLRMGPSYVVIKKGEHGSILFHGEKIFFVPAYPVNRVADPTGAGDSYAGAFMGYLAAGKRVTPRHIRRALVYASSTASFCVEGFSIERFEKVTRTEVMERAAELANMMRV